MVRLSINSQGLEIIDTIIINQQAEQLPIADSWT